MGFYLFGSEYFWSSFYIVTFLKILVYGHENSNIINNIDIMANYYSLFGYFHIES